MAKKTNKALAKRVKMTKGGALQVRPNNRSHYNAHERNPSKMKKKGWLRLSLPKRVLSQFLPHGK
ncbi:MAG: hypothetical protein ACKKL4_01950 [Patescibacteria group bacterium]